MKRAVSVCVCLLMLAFSASMFGACDMLGLDITFHTVEFRYTVGEGQYDYTAEIEDGYELDEPYDEEVAENYYIIWTINDQVVSFPVMINGNCTFVGNAFPYDSAEEAVFF